MYTGTAEMRNFRPIDGELRQWFPSDVGGDSPTMCNLIYSAPPSEYDVGGDLFNAPEPIIEEPILELDPVTAAICMMSNGEDVISAEAMKVADIESIQNEHLLSEVFYDCKKELLEKSAIKESFPEPPNYSLPAVHVEDDPDSSVSGGQLQKSVSSGCLKSTEWTQDSPVKPYLDGLQEVNLEDAYGIRRTYSEGDIHYACRKALADSQPRVRGRFAKSKACEASAELPAQRNL